MFLISDDPETAAAGGRETETAGRERSDGGESSERRSWYRHTFTHLYSVSEIAQTSEVQTLVLRK